MDVHPHRLLVGRSAVRIEQTAVDAERCLARGRTNGFDPPGMPHLHGEQRQGIVLGCSARRGLRRPPVCAHGRCTSWCAFREGGAVANVDLPPTHPDTAGCGLGSRDVRADRRCVDGHGHGGVVRTALPFKRHLGCLAMGSGRRDAWTWSCMVTGHEYRRCGLPSPGLCAALALGATK